MIEVEGADATCLTCPAAGEVLAVDAVSFHVGAGEVYGLLGPKRRRQDEPPCACCWTAATDGRLGDGRRLSLGPAADEVKRRVGLVSGDRRPLPALSVREMLLFFAICNGCEAGQAGAELEQAGRVTGDLTSCCAAAAPTLSTGQKQRVNLGGERLIPSPRVLLPGTSRRWDWTSFGSQVVCEFITHLREKARRSS